jgi:hypothetical protein
MKKSILSAVVLAALAGGLLTLTTATVARDAHAISGPASQVPTIAFHWESLGVAAGAVITSPVFKAELVTECMIAADNSAGGVSRSLNVDFIGLDGTTIIYRQVVTVTNGTRSAVGIGSMSQTASLPSGIVVIPVATPKRLQVTLAAAGAAAGSLSVTCR